MIEFLNKYEDAFSLIASLGALISALVAFFTVYEIKKQRLSLYKPDVLLKSFIVSITKSPLQHSSKELIKYKVRDLNDTKENIHKLDFQLEPRFKFENLGFGIAKRIKCKWQFDEKKALQKINEIIPNKYEIKSNEGWKTIELINKESQTVQWTCWSDPNFNQQEINYIAPININEHHHYLPIPDIILFMHWLFLLFNENLIETTGYNFYHFDFKESGFPVPKLRVEYFDLNNKIYKKNIELSVFAITMSVKEELDLTKEFAFLQFEVK